MVLSDAWKRWFSSPSRAEHASLRHHIRWLRAYNERLKAKYDGAGTNPEMERYWSQADHRSPRAANDISVRCKLRSRSRYECCESNSFARGMVLAKGNDIIGVGPMLQVTTEDNDLNKAIETKWESYARSIMLPRKLRTVQIAKIVDGESFAQRTFNQKNRDQVKLDVLRTEADLWTDPYADGSDPDYVDGVRYDGQGNPVSYRRLRSHPGDNYNLDTQADDYDADDVIHWYREDRPDQRRGVPEFTPALPLFAELRRYRLAVLSAAETAADFTAIMYSDASAFNENPDEMDEDFIKIDLERRTMMTLPAGWKMSQLKAEQPTTEFGAFSEHILMEIGRVCQMPLNLVAGTSKDYNFASGRLDYMLYWSHCDVERYDFGLAVMDQIFGWWLDEALLVPGYLPSFGDVRDVPHEWIWPPRRPIDEVNAAQADQIRWQLGYLTDEAWAKREQVDLAQHYDELARMIEARSAIGAPVPNASSQQQQNADNGQNPGSQPNETENDNQTRPAEETPA